MAIIKKIGTWLRERLGAPGAPSVFGGSSGIEAPMHLPEASEVFCAGGAPTVTFIDRSATKSYREIDFALKQRGKIISLHGESKSGKTVLCLQALKNRNPVLVHASDAKSLDHFWPTVRQYLELPAATRVESATRGSTESVQEVTAKVSTGAYLKAEVGAKLQEKQTSQDEAVKAAEFGPAGKGELIGRILKRGGVIVIDDFHWLSADVQKELLRDLRPFLNSNGTIVVISVPERAHQILQSDKEMGKLCRVVAAPDWELDEIVRIGRIGFDALNVEIDDAVLRKLATFSHKNPMLMQEYCYRVCEHATVAQKESVRRKLTITAANIATIVTNAASQNWAEWRPDGLGRELSWRTARGRPVDIYVLVLLGMRHIGYKQEIGTAALSTRIGTIVGDNKRPDKATITRALVQLSTLMKEEHDDNTPLEYADGTVYFLDPFFMAYIQWVLAKSVGEPTPASAETEAS